jgi:hypothetical protein
MNKSLRAWEAIDDVPDDNARHAAAGFQVLGNNNDQFM